MTEMNRTLIALLTVAVIGGMLFSGCVVPPPEPPPEAPVTSSEPTPEETPPPAPSTTTSPAVSPCQNVESTYQKAPATITIQSDGQEVRVNLVKLVGSVSCPDTTVLVNNTPAIVSGDGSYYSFLDLAEGKNIIEIKTIQGVSTNTESITVFFTPPLMIKLTGSEFSGDVHNDKAPMKVTGVVNNSKAKVTVNGHEAKVAQDGTFSVQIELELGICSKIQMIAVLGEEVDVDELVFAKGFAIVPGQAIFWFPRIILPNSAIKLKAGETGSLTAVLRIKKHFAGRSELSVVRFSQGMEQPMIPGLIADVNPSDFNISYPNIDYQLTINVKTSPELASGEYYFRVKGGHYSTSEEITVTIEP
jgi:hypothetical protein